MEPGIDEIIQTVQRTCEERGTELDASIVNALCDHILCAESSLQNSPRLQRITQLQPLSFARLLKPNASEAAELSLPMGPENKLLTFILQSERALQGIIYGLQQESITLHEAPPCISDKRYSAATKAQNAFHTARTGLLEQLGMPRLNKVIDRDIATYAQSLTRY